MNLNEKIDCIPPKRVPPDHLLIAFACLCCMLVLFIGTWGIVKADINRAEKKQRIQDSIVCIKGQLYTIQNGKTILLEQNGKPIMCK